MSAAATGWVYEHSPYIGAAFALHLAIADVANDAHGNEVWMSVPTMARKARLSERHVRRELVRFVRDGMLSVVSREAGKSVCYRFETPVGHPGHHVTPVRRSPLTDGAGTPDNGRAGTPDTRSPNPKEGRNPRNAGVADHRRAVLPPPVEEVLAGRPDPDPALNKAGAIAARAALRNPRTNA